MIKSQISKRFTCFFHSRLALTFSDAEEIFSIMPAIARIPANQTALFEVIFSPNKEDNLFAKDLVGHVFSEQQKDDFYEEILTFPTIVSVRLIGKCVSCFVYIINTRLFKSID